MKNMKKLIYRLTGLFILISQSLYADISHIKITANEWPPYTSAHITEGGLVIELIRAAFAEEDIPTSFQIVPWARAMASVEATQADVIAAWYSDTRNKKFMYSKSFFVNRMVFVKRVDESVQWQTLDDLRDYSFVLMRGAVNEAEFDAADWLKKSWVTEEETAVTMVVKGRADMTVRDQGMVEYLMQTKPETFAGKIDFVEKELSNSPLYLIVSRQHPEKELILQHFNSGINKIRQNGIYQSLLAKYGSGQH